MTDDIPDKITKTLQDSDETSITLQVLGPEDSPVRSDLKIAAHRSSLELALMARKLIQVTGFDVETFNKTLDLEGSCYEPDDDSGSEQHRNEAEPPQFPN